jgi:hypothetical protein
VAPLTSRFEECGGRLAVTFGMLVDPVIFPIDERSFVILTLIGGASPRPLRIGPGRYAVHHFGMDQCLPGGSSFDGVGAAWHEYPAIDVDGRFFGPYGVCDSPDQFMAHPLGSFVTKSPRLFTVSFTLIAKSDQCEDGGWRWHKWGEYIGEKEPQCEYLYDEGPEITEVYCYHVYECLDDTKIVAS